MSIVNPTLPNPGDPRGGEETDVRNALVAILADHNGNIDDDNIKSAAGIQWSKLANGTAVLDQLGANGDATVRRGRSVIAGAGTRTNTVYGALDGGAAPGPDQVSGIVVPANAKLLISYQALIKNSAGNTGLVAIFLGSDQLKQPIGTGAPSVAETAISSDTDFGWIYTTPSAVFGWAVAIGVGDATSVTTGMLLGRNIEVDVAPGTYVVAVMFKSSSGTVTAKERKLFVKAEAY
jgi:hypothetical protein